jgi:hypothetical protein
MEPTSNFDLSAGTREPQRSQASDFSHDLGRTVLNSRSAFGGQPRFHLR